MYHTNKNYLEQHGPKTGLGASSSNLWIAPRVENPFAVTPAPDHGALRLNHTMPETAESFDEQSIKRTGSGGLFFCRKRSEQDRKELSRARATEMISQFEQSDDKEDSLNRKATFRSDFQMAPSLSGALVNGPHAVAAAYAKTSSKEELKARDPFRTEGERLFKPANSQPTRPPLTQQDNLIRTENQPGPIPFRRSRSQKQQEKIRLARAALARLQAKNADQELPQEVGVDIVPLSPGSYSLVSSASKGGRVLRNVHELC
jgi:hypothetical protein